MNAAACPRSLDEGGASRIVQNMDVLPEAPTDGFTAFLKAPPPSRLRHPEASTVHG
jgi:hypothetical protein